MADALGLELVDGEGPWLGEVRGAGDARGDSAGRGAALPRGDASGAIRIWADGEGRPVPEGAGDARRVLRMPKKSVFLRAVSILPRLRKKSRLMKRRTAIQARQPTPLPGPPPPLAARFGIR